MKKCIKPLLLLICAALLSSCSIMQALALKDCSYAYDRVSDVTFLGLKSNELVSFSAIAKVTSALIGKSDEVPLGFTVHMKVSNPNQRTASVDKVFYTVLLDTIQVASGCTTEPLIVAGESSVDMPMRFVFDLKTMLNSGSYPTLSKLVKNFIGLGDDPTKVTVNLRPVVRVGSVALSVPKSIPLSFEYGGKKQK